MVTMRDIDSIRRVIDGVQKNMADMLATEQRIIQMLTNLTERVKKLEQGLNDSEN